MVDETFEISCGIVCSGWPSWALAAKIRKWTVKIIIIKNSLWISEIKSLFPNVCILDYMDLESWLSLGLNIQFWLSDIDPPRKLSVFSTNAQAVVTCQRVRAFRAGEWTWQVIKLAHAECGGATDGEWNFHVYKRPDAEALASLSPLPPRDLSGILNIKAHGIPCRPPAVQDLNPGKVVSLSKGLYHGGGLYPINIKELRVVTPCVFSPTGWVKRKVTGRELCLIKDIPEDIVDSLPASKIAAICQDTSTLPLKVALRFLDLLVNEGHIPDIQRNNTVVTPLEVEEIEKTKALGQTELDRNQRAVKADDVEVPEYLWDQVLVPRGNPDKVKALGQLRRFALRWWKNNMRKSFLGWFFIRYSLLRWKLRNIKHSYAEWNVCLRTYLRSSTEARKDWIAGGDCIERCCNSSWWEWTDGSRPHFWRWSEEYKILVRDGVPPWFKRALPRWQVPQRVEKILTLRLAMKKKLEKVRRWRYMIPGQVKSLTSFFAVPKGENDIRMVYDGTKSGLNDAMWAPWFSLPTIETHLRFVNECSFMGDIDIGDMFHNFILHGKNQCVAGVDLTSFFPEEMVLKGFAQVLWEHWSRCGMGFKPSPYYAIQGILFADEYIRGDPSDQSNVFRWDEVSLNLPGSQEYDPSKPWVSKRRSSDGKIAADFVIYVDDVRSAGNSWEEARLASRRIGSLLNWLGVQDAARKRRDPSRTPGAWAGSIIHTAGGVVTVSVSQERWDKAKTIVDWIEKSMNEGEDIEFKKLESYRGFLIYLVRTYPDINPYLKGVHLTLDSWRPWRRPDGWKLTLSEIRTALDEKKYEEGMSFTGTTKAPLRVKWVPRLVDDVRALKALFESKIPPKG